MSRRTNSKSIVCAMRSTLCNPDSEGQRVLYTVCLSMHNTACLPVIRCNYFPRTAFAVIVGIRFARTPQLTLASGSTFASWSLLASQSGLIS